MAECTLAETFSTGYARAGPHISPYSERDCVKSLRSSYTGLYPQNTLISASPSCLKLQTSFLKNLEVCSLSLSCSLALSQGAGAASYKFSDQGAPLPRIQHEHSFGNPQHPTVLHTVAPYRNLFRSLESTVSLVECRR